MHLPPTVAGVSRDEDMPLLGTGIDRLWLVRVKDDREWVRLRIGDALPTVRRTRNEEEAESG
jgi:hypothetical protein